MKHVFYLLLLFTLIWACSSPEKSLVLEETKVTGGFDSLRAAKAGADVYGMRRYVIAYLRKGPNRDQDSLQAAEIQRAHLDNIQRMADLGKLVLAGPYLDDHDIMGIYVFAVETIEEAEELTRTDPAIQAGRLLMEMHPWYGSAALMEVNEIHAQLAKEKI